MANFYFNKLIRIDIRKNFLSLNFQRSNLRTKTESPDRVSPQEEEN